MRKSAKKRQSQVQTISEQLLAEALFKFMVL